MDVWKRSRLPVPHSRDLIPPVLSYDVEFACSIYETKLATNRQRAREARPQNDLLSVCTDLQDRFLHLYETDIPVFVGV